MLITTLWKPDDLNFSQTNCRYFSYYVFSFFHNYADSTIQNSSSWYCYSAFVNWTLKVIGIHLVTKATSKQSLFEIVWGIEYKHGRPFKFSITNPLTTNVFQFKMMLKLESDVKRILVIGEFRKKCLRLTYLYK